jgi:hypothetical protein
MTKKVILLIVFFFISKIIFADILNNNDRSSYFDRLLSIYNDLAINISDTDDLLGLRFGRCFQSSDKNRAYFGYLASYYDSPAGPVFAEEHILKVGNYNYNYDDVIDNAKEKKEEVFNYIKHSLNNLKLEGLLVDIELGFVDGILTDHYLGKAKYENRYYEQEIEVCFKYYNDYIISVSTLLKITPPSNHFPPPGLPYMICYFEKYQ